jgi:hypothetical protein
VGNSDRSSEDQNADRNTNSIGQAHEGSEGSKDSVWK